MKIPTLTLLDGPTAPAGGWADLPRKKKVLGRTQERGTGKRNGGINSKHLSKQELKKKKSGAKTQKDQRQRHPEGES